MEKSVTDFVPISDRVMLLKMQTNHRPLNIIQIYAPTFDKSDDEVESFYTHLEEVMRLTKKGEISIIMGDFNSKIGSGADGETVGRYGLGIRNSRGDRLLQFCIEHDFVITNTFFKLHPRRLYTWKSPADKEDNIIRNQIDFILVKRDHKKFVKQVKTYPGADINSDHNPVVMDFRFQRFTNSKKPNKGSPVDIRKLKSPEIQLKIKQNIEEALSSIQVSSEPINIETTWDGIKTKIVNIQETMLKTENNNAKQQWITPEILGLMNDRRQHKGNDTKHRQIHKIIQRKCKEAKERWMADKCKEIEQLQEKHDTFNLHKKIKEMSGRYRKSPGSILRNTNNEIVIGIEEKLKTWTDYIQNLFSDDRADTAPNLNDIVEEGPEITKGEVIHAINLQKNGKAVGPDRVHTEVLKLIAEQDGNGLSLLTALFNAIYRSGKIPSDWLKSTFITLPKKANSSSCDDYRLISLMSHVLKIFLRVIHTRIYKKCDLLVDETQFGFRNGVGAREALFSLNVLTQRCRDMNVDVYACFIDFRKAFDNVKHQKLIEILKSSGIDKRDVAIITELYWHQTAEINIDQNISESIRIKKGVRQGCILSPLLFNIYSEAIFRESLDEETSGIKINGNLINNIRYADDTVILSDSLLELQNMMNRIAYHCRQFGLEINISKTKLMVFSKTHRDATLYINQVLVEQVFSFRYLGAIINERCDPKSEIKARIQQARRTFTNMKRLFVSSNLSLQLKIRMIRCYIFPVLLYGCESWTLDAQMEKRIEAFEMYLYRRILKISWTQRITNIEVLNKLNQQKELLFNVKKRKTFYLGHIMRGNRYALLKLIIEGKIRGKRSVGRRQNSWLKDLRRWFNRTSTDIFRAAASKTMLVIWIANLQKETV